jgi:hypothetical protein
MREVAALLNLVASKIAAVITVTATGGGEPNEVQIANTN